MIVQFRSGFEKDLFLAHDKKLAQTILDCIQLFENAERLIEIPNIKKIKGTKQLSGIGKANTV